MLFGFACIAMARWSRSRGSNALVLMQREEALKAEQDRQKVLAANLERNRIGHGHAGRGIEYVGIGGSRKPMMGWPC